MKKVKKATRAAIMAAVITAALSGVPVKKEDITKAREYLYEAIERQLDKVDKRYFTVQRYRYNDKIYGDYRGRVFRVDHEEPYKAGIHELVHIYNPEFNEAEIQLFGELAEQLHDNKEVENLQPGERKIVHFNHRKTVGVLMPDMKIAVPKQIGLGTLENLEAILKK